MANTIGFGQAAVNNTIGFGQAPANNTIDFGEVCADSWSPETNLTGAGGTDAFSFSFDGIDEYFLGQNTYTELDGQNDFTFSFWIKPTNLTSKIVFSIGNGAADSRAQQFFFMLFSTGQVYMYMRDLGKYARTAGGAITANVWQHVLICRDQNEAIGQKAKIFINGLDVTSYENTRYYSNTTPATTGLMIGEHTNNQYTPFVGNIDEFAIWSGTDLRNDVATIYNNGEPNDLNELATPPTTWHRMGENATWDGSIWTMTDVNGGYISNSVNMAEANRTTDVPPNPFANTKSIALDGIDDFITMGNTIDFANDGTEAFSFSCWFKTTDTASQFLISKQSRTSPFNGYNINLNTNKIGIFLGTTSSNARIQGSTSTITSISDGNWHHLAVTYDGSQDISGFTIYYDNSTQAITTINANNTPNNIVNSSDFMLGARGTAASYNKLYDGLLDEVSYFDSEISSSDVNAIYGAGVPNDISSLSPLSFWRCGDNDTSPTLTDRGSGGNNGTMTNFSTFSTDVPT